MKSVKMLSRIKKEYSLQNKHTHTHKKRRSNTVSTGQCEIVCVEKIANHKTERFLPAREEKS